MGAIIPLSTLGEGPAPSTRAWRCMCRGRIPGTLTPPSKNNLLCDFSSLVKFFRLQPGDSARHSLQLVLNRDLAKRRVNARTSLWNGSGCHLSAPFSAWHSGRQSVAPELLAGLPGRRMLHGPPHVTPLLALCFRP